jgi:hypothetical protein
MKVESEKIEKIHQNQEKICNFAMEKMVNG